MSKAGLTSCIKLLNACLVFVAIVMSLLCVTGIRQDGLISRKKERLFKSPGWTAFSSSQSQTIRNGRDAARLYERIFKYIQDNSADVERLRYSTSKNRHPVSRSEYNKLITKHKHMLELLHQATQMPRCNFIPDRAASIILLPHLGHIRRCTDALLTRAVMEVEDGRFAVARTALEDIMGLLQAIGSDGNYSSYTCGLHLERHMLICLKTMASNGKLTSDQCRSLLSMLSELRRQDKHRHFVMLHGELFRVRGFFEYWFLQKGDYCYLYSSPPLNGSKWLCSTQIYKPIIKSDYLNALVLFEDYLSNTGDGPWLNRRLWRFFEERDRILPHIGSFYSRHCLLTILSDASIREADCDIYLSMLELTLALEIYRSEHGRYPKTLDDLSPNIQQKLPVDPFVEKPYIYKRKGDRYELSLSEEALLLMKRIKERWKIVPTC
ncbi:MAG: hypothetical protein PHT33_07415 [bacterium]|nr:hypothetical protein [bacterium]